MQSHLFSDEDEIVLAIHLLPHSIPFKARLNLINLWMFREQTIYVSGHSRDDLNGIGRRAEGVRREDAELSEIIKVYNNEFFTLCVCLQQ